MSLGIDHAAFVRVAALAACLGLLPVLSARAEDQAQTPPASQASSETGASPPAIDVKKLFAAQCGWCHADYGMKAGKAPQLAGTQMTEKQVRDRIRNGKEDAMPSFKRTLTDDQIQAFAKYIKDLKTTE